MIRRDVPEHYSSSSLERLANKSHGYYTKKHPHALNHVVQEQGSTDGKLLLNEIHDLIVMMISQMVREVDYYPKTTPVSIRANSFSTGLSYF